MKSKDNFKLCWKEIGSWCQKLHETTLRSVRRGEAELLAGPFCLWFLKNQVMPSVNGITPSGNGI